MNEEINKNIENVENVENVDSNNSLNVSEIVENIEILYLVYNGNTQNIERPIKNLGEYSDHLQTIEECIKEGSDVFNEIKNNLDSVKELDFAVWAKLSSSILPLIRKAYSKYDDVNDFTTVKRLELGVIVTYEIVFNHYYDLHNKNEINENDKKVANFVFSDEGKLAIRCVCNATVTVFNELDENKDGKISCSEVKSCLCTPKKWGNIFKACMPKKRRN